MQTLWYLLALVLLCLFAFSTASAVKLWQFAIGWRWTASGANYIDDNAVLSRVGHWLLALKKRGKGFGKLQDALGGCTICSTFQLANYTYILLCLCCWRFPVPFHWCIVALFWFIYQLIAFSSLSWVYDPQYSSEKKAMKTWENETLIQ
jgi:hypothetical protein